MNHPLLVNLLKSLLCRHYTEVAYTDDERATTYLLELGHANPGDDSRNLWDQLLMSR